MTELIDKIKRIGLLQTIDDLAGNRFQYLKYLWCRLSNRPYFGSYLVAKQGRSIRHYYMQEVIRNYSENYNGDIKILEIGSWAGGSAITWADAIKRYSTKQGKILCVDQWIDYIDLTKDRKWTHRTMKKAFQNNKIYKLFLHNILVAGCSNMLSIIRGSSDEILPMLKECQFDLIFIDGNHSYEFAYNDIKNSAILVKDGGILCGDDLQLQYDDIDIDTMFKMRDRDLIVDPLTKKHYHPGVSMAVHEYFKKKISSWEGFWAMKKAGNDWNHISIDIKQECISIPEHLR